MYNRVETNKNIICHESEAENHWKNEKCELKNSTLYFVINQRERRKKSKHKKKPHRVNKRRKIQSHFGANSRKKNFVALCQQNFLIVSNFSIHFQGKTFLFLSGKNCVYCLHESESHVGNLRRFPAQDEWHKIKITCRHSFIIQQPQHTRTRYDDMKGMEKIHPET